MKKLIKKCMKNVFFVWIVRFLLSVKSIFNNRKKTAIAVYDLAVNPTTFDFVWFLYEAYIHFKAKGIMRFDVIIKPSSLERQWEVEAKKNLIITPQHKKQRIYNIILPQANLFYECKNVHLIEDEMVINRMLMSANYTYPEAYTYFSPQKMSINKVWEHTDAVDFKGFSASSSDIDHVEKWLKLHDIGSRFVSISLRSYGFQDSRNSNIPLIKEFIIYLNKNGFDHVIIPDTDEIEGASNFPDSSIFYQGSFNMFQRNAIYQLAYTNLFTSNGVAAVSVFNPKSSFIFTKFVNDYWPVKAHEARGLKFGSQPLANDRGIWLWEDESIENLISSFQKIEEWKN